MISSHERSRNYQHENNVIPRSNIAIFNIRNGSTKHIKFCGFDAENSAYKTSNIGNNWNQIFL